MKGLAFFRITAVILLVLSAVVACEGEAAQPVEPQTFVVEVSGEQFKVRVTHAADIAALQQRMSDGRVGVISGKLVSGNGGFNSPWSWHLDPDTVHAPDVSTEVCDGRPSFVEADLEHWLTAVVYYCPWGARVVRTED